MDKLGSVASRLNFEATLKQFLPKTHWAIIRNIKESFGAYFMYRDGEKKIVNFMLNPVPVTNGVETLVASTSSDGKLDFRPRLKPGQKVRLAAGTFAEQLV